MYTQRDNNTISTVCTTLRIYSDIVNHNPRVVICNESKKKTGQLTGFGDGEAQKPADGRSRPTRKSPTKQ